MSGWRMVSSRRSSGGGGCSPITGGGSTGQAGATPPRGRGRRCWGWRAGWVVAIVAYTLMLKRARIRDFRLLYGPMIVLVVGGASVAFQYAFTGDVVATSILSRRVLAMPDLVGFGTIRLDPTFATRLLV